MLWGAKVLTLILDLKPHLPTRIRPRRSKCLEMFEGTGSRGLSSSNLTNVSQVSFCLTWVSFQDIPATKIDFRCVKKRLEYENILGKSCYHRIKCTIAVFLAALMWRRPLNSVFNHYRLQKTRKAAQIWQRFEYRVGW